MYLLGSYTYKVGEYVPALLLMYGKISFSNKTLYNIITDYGGVLPHPVHVYEFPGHYVLLLCSPPRHLQPLRSPRCTLEGGSSFWAEITVRQILPEDSVHFQTLAAN